MQINREHKEGAHPPSFIYQNVNNDSALCAQVRVLQGTWIAEYIKCAIKWNILLESGMHIPISDFTAQIFRYDDFIKIQVLNGHAQLLNNLLIPVNTKISHKWPAFHSSAS